MKACTIICTITMAALAAACSPQGDTTERGGTASAGGTDAQRPSTPSATTPVTAQLSDADICRVMLSIPKNSKASPLAAQGGGCTIQRDSSGLVVRHPARGKLRVVPATLDASLPLEKSGGFGTSRPSDMDGFSVGASGAWAVPPSASPLCMTARHLAPSGNADSAFLMTSSDAEVRNIALSRTDGTPKTVTVRLTDGATAEPLLVVLAPREYGAAIAAPTIAPCP